MNFLDFSTTIPEMPFILEGLGVTLKVVAAAAVLGFLLGVVITLLKISSIKPLAWIADFYTSIFRGTPLVLQLMIVYYGLPQVLGFDIDAYWAAVIAFGLNSAAYVSEIIRAGINAIDKGQKEAAMALGVPYAKMMKDLLLPQAFKNIMPALINESITLTKESAVVTVIGLGDIMRRSYQAGAAIYSPLEPMLFAGLIYYVLVLILTFVGKAIERKLNVND
ncbi:MULTISPECIES: amino acid ABC transporter permease [Bacillus]|nr:MULTISPECIES: amino acid ABC transporter permease [Bacillus]MCJ2147815.1 amino acid ABC transporter permease [Bacillus sp. B19-2]MDN5385935.1 amino acid ABC transporter permease [Bacillus sp. LB7]MEC1022038.1 amino acid ABC transporter permease [Bacillus paralicheniformis]MEC1026089.1 amino acid ABC transporter permease [Bacillus paralicheniformis]MEC1035233.1 amino acid ABC transporter permease [Bacillus paralicheniformis]